MSETPWPEAETATVLFLIDAAHLREEKLLQDWIARTRPAVAVAGQVSKVSQVVVPIAHDPENIPIEKLAAELQQGHPAETLVVPLRVAWRTSMDEKGTSPRLLDLLRGNPRRPGSRRAARMLRKDPECAQCLVAEGATLEELRARLRAREGAADDAPALAEFVAGQAAVALDIAERRLRGSRYKVPRQVARNLQSSAKFRTALQAVAEETGREPQELEAETASILKELVAIPRAFWQDFLAAFNRKFISMGYEGEFVIDADRLAEFRKTIREYPAAILWTHKTHVDGFAMYSMMFENDCPAPHVLGGVNMAFAGLGFVARRSGAIFIRRSFQGDPLYKMILRQYIGYLLEKRFPLTWAFEGTRSRVGKLMPPKYGLLKYVIEAAHATDARDLHILPVAINYDLIGDVADYAAEQSGKTKRPESLSWFLGYLRGLRKPLGRIYVDFGKPVVLPTAPSADDAMAVAKIGFQVGVEVNRVIPLTLASLVTMVLMGAAPRALTRRELRKEMIRLLAWSAERGIRTTSALQQGNDEQLSVLAETLVGNGLISRYDEGPDTVYAIAPQQHAVAGYYRNTIIHHFVNKAIIELALLHSAGADDGEAAFWQEAERLRDWFKFEFFYAPSEQFHAEVESEMQRYDPKWKTALGSEASVAQLRRFRPLVAHCTLLSFVEAYRVVANVLQQLNHDQTLSEKECLSRAFAHGRQAYLQRRISSEASIGKLLFQNGYKLAAHLGLIEAGGVEVAERRRQFSKDMRNLAVRIDRIRALALPDLLDD